MKNFIVYNIDGKILSTGLCQNSTFHKQARKGEFIIEGKAYDGTQKIVDGKIVNKSPQELPQPKAKVIITKENQTITLTKGQLANIYARLAALEGKQ